jgi:ribosomal-protein-alanine N-acetyltransferase
MYFKELETERLILRRYKYEDIELYHELTNDPKLLEFNYYPNTTREYEEEYVRNLVDNCDTNKYESWVIERKIDHEPVGKINITKIIQRFNYCEVGYTIRYKYWGNGYASEALEEVTKHLLNDIGYRLVECVIDETNTKSIKVVEKAGFIKDGYVANRKKGNDGTYHGILYYSKSKE